jgi:hypothetical protein
VETAVPVPQPVDDAGEPPGAVAGCQLLPDAVLEQRLDRRQVGRLDAGGEQLLQVTVLFAPVAGRVTGRPVSST